MKRSRCIPALARSSIGASLALALVAHAQVRTDGTLGGPVVSLNGPSIVIDQALGRLAGSNLFQSFQVFNVRTGESATFVTTTPGLANVVSRVTGGSPSAINGLIRLASTDATPNFFFINPAGVVFGSGAAIDVPAAFHVATANYVKFPDGNFYADPRAVSTLSASAPEAFGFLGSTRTTIALKDGAVLRTGAASADQSVAIVAGDIAIDGAGVQATRGAIRVVAVGATNEEVALSGPAPRAAGEVSLTNGGFLLTVPAGAAKAGDILVAAGNAVIDGGNAGSFTGIASQTQSRTTGSAGNIDVRVENALALSNGGTIGTITATSGQGGAVSVHADSLSLSRGALISTNTQASGTAGNVIVVARDIALDGQGLDAVTGITSQAIAGRGNAGAVDVAASRSLTIVNGGAILSDTFAAGQAGAIHVTAADILIDNRDSPSFTGLASQANPGSTGGAGSLAIDVAGTLAIVNGGAITSSTFSAGNAGAIAIDAGSVRIDGRGNTRFDTGIFSAAGPNPANPASVKGNAGSIDVRVRDALALVDGGAVSSSTFGSGNAGVVSVSAGDIVIDGGPSGVGITGITTFASFGSSGNAGNIAVAASGKLSLLRGGEIISDANASGRGGTVKVSAANIVIDSSGGELLSGIFTTANPGSSGNGGSIDIATPGTLAISNHGAIDSSTSGGGAGGSIKVTAGTLSIASGGEIGSGTFASGPAGSVQIDARTLDMSGHALIFANAGSESSGQTGTIAVHASDAMALSGGAAISIGNFARVPDPAVLAPTTLSIDAPNVSLASGSQITAASFGNVAASNVDITFGPQMFVSSAAIATTAQDGNGGGIRVQGNGTLLLQNGQVTTSVNGQQGNGGDIRIATPILVMQTGFIQANTAAAAASGGDVAIHVASLLPSAGTLFVGGSIPYTFSPGVFGFNVIQAAAPTGVSGNIVISTPALDITGSLAALPAKFIDGGGPGRSPCAIAGGSSLAQVGRGGMPTLAGNLLWLDPTDESDTPRAGDTEAAHAAATPRSLFGGNGRSLLAPCRSGST